MPLTYDDREDLHIEIERLRKECERLVRERDEALNCLNKIKSRWPSLFSLLLSSRRK